MVSIDAARNIGMMKASSVDRVIVDFSVHSPLSLVAFT
jgi:hypothetical protein